MPGEVAKQLQDLDSASPLVRLSRKGHTLVVRIDNPPVNALHPDVANALLAVTRDVEEDPSVRSFVLTGTGRCFVAGGDIKYFTKLDSGTAAEMALTVQTMQAALHHLRVPVIAALNGHALGGGLELMLACDIAIAEEQALLGLPEVTLGLIPGAGGTRMLCRTIPRGTAKRLLFTGDRIGAREAHELGLVDEVTPQGEVLNRALAMAERINAAGPLAVAAAKKSANYGLDHSLDDGHRREVELFSALFQSADHREGIEAFLSRRQPRFIGR